MSAKKIDVPMLFRLWGEGHDAAEIARRLGVKRGSFWAIKERHKLPPRQRPKPRGDSRPRPDPTPAEILERAAEVRAGWPPGEAERRLVGATLAPVTVQEFCWDGYAFSTLD